GKVLLTLGQLNVGKTHGVKVIVRQRDETEPSPPELHDLFDHRVRSSLAWTLAVGPPNRAERAMFRASADGLHRGPHVLRRIQQIPARHFELAGINAATFIHALRGAV